jgi:hypothetical protein
MDTAETSPERKRQKLHTQAGRPASQYSVPYPKLSWWVLHSMYTEKQTHWIQVHTVGAELILSSMTRKHVWCFPNRPRLFLISPSRSRRCLPCILHPFNNLTYIYTLLETETLPSVWDFAECFLSGHSVNIYFAECPDKKHSAKYSTQQSSLCRVSGTRQSKTLGKPLLCRVPRHLAKFTLGKQSPTRGGDHL